MGGPPLNWPYGRFRGGPPAGWAACGHLLRLWTTHAVHLWEEEARIGLGAIASMDLEQSGLKYGNFLKELSEDVNLFSS
jgi:hypothetical protein